MLKTVTICRSVYPLRFILLLGILFSFNVFAKQNREEYIIEREHWKAFIRLSDGTVDRYEFREHGVWKTIPFRHDRMAGPAWDGIMLAHDKKNPGSFIGEKDHLKDHSGRKYKRMDKRPPVFRRGKHGNHRFGFGTSIRCEYYH